MDTAIFGPVTQLGHLTDDIEATARAWTKATGIGPWTRMSDVNMAANVNGEDVEIKIDVALCYQGDVQIELIKPLCDTPSPYSEYKKAGFWGLHHVQYVTDDMEASLAKAEAAGLELACRIEQGGGIYCYLRGHGIWFELMQPSEGLMGLFQFIKSSCETWDGKELIREFGI